MCVRWGDEVLICDAGTGIRPLGFHLANSGAPTSGHVFIGHTHWDHIQGFPFFFPAYLPKNKWAIHSAKGVGDSFEAIFRRQMGINYFPVEVGDMAASLDFSQVDGRPFNAGAAKVSTIYTNHPGICVGYRFEMGGRSVVYLTDHETIGPRAAAVLGRLDRGGRLLPRRGPHLRLAVHRGGVRQKRAGATAAGRRPWPWAWPPGQAAGPPPRPGALRRRHRRHHGRGEPWC